MKKLIASLLALTVLVGCGDDDDDNSVDFHEPVVNERRGGDRTVDAYYDPDWTYHEVATPNGTIECIYADLGKGGGPTCNWEEFNKEK